MGVCRQVEGRKEKGMMGGGGKLRGRIASKKSGWIKRNERKGNEEKKINSSKSKEQGSGERKEGGREVGREDGRENGRETHLPPPT